jgi:hypothetical protein
MYGSAVSVETLCFNGFRPPVKLTESTRCGDRSNTFVFQPAPPSTPTHESECRRRTRSQFSCPGASVQLPTRRSESGLPAQRYRCHGLSTTAGQNRPQPENRATPVCEKLSSAALCGILFFLGVSTTRHAKSLLLDGVPPVRRGLAISAVFCRFHLQNRGIRRRVSTAMTFVTCPRLTFGLIAPGVQFGSGRVSPLAAVR